MAGKIGEGYFRDMVDRGRRELGGFFYEGSNIAQPMYPLRGEAAQVKEVDASDQHGNKPSYEELHPADPPRDDPGLDHRDRELERE